MVFKLQTSRGKFDRAVYSLLRRIGIADRRLLFCGMVSRISETSFGHLNQADCRDLPLEAFAALGECNPDFVSDAFRQARSDTVPLLYPVAERADICICLAGTGLPIYLDERTAYLFSAFVSTFFRGQRSYQALQSHIARYEAQNGINRITLTIDLLNTSAIKAVQHIWLELFGETQFT